MTTTKKTAPAAAKAEDPKPIMSADLRLKQEPPQMTPPRRGPMTGMSSMSDRDFVSQYSNPEELASFRAAVEQRLGQPPQWRWERCDHCNLAMRVPASTPPDGICVRCNWRRDERGGYMRTMADREVNEHLYKQAAKDKAEAERMRRAAFNERNLERAKAGLPPLTFEAFAAQAKAELEELKARGKALGQVAAAFRRQP